MKKLLALGIALLPTAYLISNYTELDMLASICFFVGVFFIGIWAESLPGSDRPKSKQEEMVDTIENYKLLTLYGKNDQMDVFGMYKK